MSPHSHLYTALAETWKAITLTSNYKDKLSLMQEYLDLVPASTKRLAIALSLSKPHIFTKKEATGLGRRLIAQAAERILLIIHKSETATKSHPRISVKLSEARLSMSDPGLFLERLYDISKYSPPSPLTMNDLASLVENIVHESSRKKLDYVVTCLMGASSDHVAFLAHSLQGTSLRIGIGSSALLPLLPSTSSRPKSTSSTQSLKIKIVPQLAKACSDLSMFEGEVEKYVFQPKYDGMRAILSTSSREKPALYSRSGKDVSERFGGLVVAAQKSVKGNHILDGEIVAVSDEGSILSFSDLMARPQKWSSKKSGPTAFYAFDILRHDGIDVSGLALSQRLHLLNSFVRTLGDGPVKLTPSMYPSSTTELLDLTRKAVSMGTEGLMAKSLKGVYKPGSRSGWWKIKKEYLGGLVPDSADLVPIGAFEGRGKFANMVGSFVMGARVSGKCEFVEVCRVGSGMSLKTRKHLEKLLRPYRIEGTAGPEKWSYHPTVVWEIRFADLTVAQKSKTPSLRFPVFVRQRPDKSVANATSVQTLQDWKDEQ